VIQAILHTDEIIERTHGPEVVLTDPPAYVVDRRMTKETLVRGVPDDLVTVGYDNDLVPEELVFVGIVDVTVEG
jgi:hypothetical protein